MTQKSAWSEFQRIRARHVKTHGLSGLDHILFGWFVEECLTCDAHQLAGIHHILHAPEELALLVLAEAERQLEVGRITYSGAGQGKWKEFVKNIGRSPLGVKLMERHVHVWSEEKQAEVMAAKQWKPIATN